MLARLSQSIGCAITRRFNPSACLPAGITTAGFARSHENSASSDGGPRPASDKLQSTKIVALALFFVATGAANAALAQTYPNKSIRIIVPYGAGGPADVYARALAHLLSESMKQPVVVEPRPGAASIIGTDAVAKSPPDGYTLLLVSNSQTTNEAMNPNRPYTLMRDLTTVAGISRTDIVLVAHPSIGATNLKQLIELAKAKPGQLNYGSSGIGTVYHMAGELLKSMAGIDLVHVPHRASGDMRNSAVGGHVQMIFDSITSIRPMIQGGQLRAIGTTGRTRSPLLPDVPTISDAGVPGFETSIWFGLMAPAGTPADIIDKLNSEVRKALTVPELRDQWMNQGIMPIEGPRAEFEKFLHDDIAKWTKFAKETGFKLN